MTVLLDVEPGQEQLFIRHDLFRVFCRLRRFCKLGNPFLLRLVLYEKPALCKYLYLYVALLRGMSRNRLFKNIYRRKRRLFAENFCSAVCHHNLRTIVFPGAVDAYVDALC